jgi:hypothetical protein
MFQIKRTKRHKVSAWNISNNKCKFSPLRIREGCRDPDRTVLSSITDAVIHVFLIEARRDDHWSCVVIMLSTAELNTFLDLFPFMTLTMCV